jgi:NitT/TauT family transport system substrate-binding protein
MLITRTRRHILSTLALGGAAASINPFHLARAADPPPETTSVRIVKYPYICYAPQYVAEDLLRAEGFTDIHYPEGEMPTAISTIPRELAENKYDFAICLGMHFVMGIDAGYPISIVSGVHAGCFELFAHEGINSVADLKGKSVGMAIANELFLSMASYVGLDPEKDVKVVSDFASNPLEQFAQGKLDAYMGIAPEPEILRSRGFNHVILRTATDDPWSQYFCCMIAVNRDYPRKNPIATKRVVRAILKAAELCSAKQEWTARQMVDRGFLPNYDLALQTIKDIPYNNWRDYDLRDSVRFYALRLHELGLIKSNPRQIAAEGTEARFYEELRRELKA